MKRRKKSPTFFKFLFQIGVVFFCIPISGSINAETEKYQNTLDALQTRYADEIIAHRKYGLYAQKAHEEGYPNVAHLFRSLAASEAVHAKNFERVLGELGHQPLLMEKVDIQVSTTKEHLKHATTVEAEEIDNEYPKILQSITPENHQDAIDSIRYAWESEKQHRDLIVKIQKAVSNWFSLIVSRIEGRGAHYYVCQICGSTLTEVPEKNCPICKHSIEHYAEVEGFPAVRKEQSDDLFDF